MIDSDLAQFSELMDELRSDYGRNPLSATMTQIDFEVLRPYSFQQITMAIIKHRGGPKAPYFPSPGDLIEHLEGGEIKADDIVAAARLADSPLGILARIHIGSWDLSNLNAFDLRQRAAECLLLLPGWKARAKDGEYTNHEISIMVKHGVNPIQPFSMGLAGPQDAQKLISRVNEVLATDRHKELLEPPYRVENETAESNENVSNLIKQIGKVD